ncbi:M23 family metallopeptidase [Oceanobacillus polygoni]|uniref:Stage IV sporulation protein FA n=1 Tax=Oceanobacillus polygoni TaxID=1235259 RepID=A0A9X0YRM1_9BACI|nr:M23 family metallopeptidase [Oceanobacillus polygoni]MBP2077448.1 stage IV sporulation protein FA [Oceanobacillus polygoni]
MDRDIKKVRKAIEQRKKVRGLPSGGGTTKQLLPSIPEAEEKHGYYSMFTHQEEVTSGNNRAVTSIAVKGILSAMLFFGTALLWQTDTTLLQKPREWTSQVMTNEFPFAKVNVWYKETFGRPLSLSPQPVLETNEEQLMALPVNGNITETFQTNGTGIMITPEEKTNVTSIQEGVVIFAGNDRETNKTVTIQHADGTVTNYGNLSNIDVHLYQFIAGNQQIGSFTPAADNETVFFSIEKNNDYVDPVQVIQVDELP